MTSSELYPLIFKRKSIRKFVKEPLDNSVIKDVENQIENLQALFEGIKTEVVMLGEKEIGGIFTIKAPHYIAIYSEEKDGFLLNAGYILQQMDLYLSKNEIGSLWLGMGKPQENLGERNGLKYVITLGLGKAKGKVHRESVSEFKRKDLSEISSLNNYKEVAEAVRLAPSSSNNQPWYLEGEDNNIDIYCKKLSFVKNTFLPLMKKFLPIDIGIACFHLKIAAENFGDTVDFYKKNNSEKSDYDYMISAEIRRS